MASTITLGGKTYPLSRWEKELKRQQRDPELLWIPPSSSREEIEQLVALLSESPEPSTRLLAAKLLEQLDVEYRGEREAVRDALLTVSENDPDSEVREQAALAHEVYLRKRRSRPRDPLEHEMFTRDERGFLTIRVERTGLYGVRHDEKLSLPVDDDSKALHDLARFTFEGLGLAGILVIDYDRLGCSIVCRTSSAIGVDALDVVTAIADHVAVGGLPGSSKKRFAVTEEGTVIVGRVEPPFWTYDSLRNHPIHYASLELYRRAGWRFTDDYFGR